jgi:hypothetical protein
MGEYMANEQRTSRKTTRKAISTAVIAVITTWATAANAIEIKTDSGWTGSWNTKLGVSAAWRTEEPEKGLIGATAAAVPALVQMNGGQKGEYSNVSFSENIGNLNYSKGEMYTAVGRFLTELTLSKGDTAFLIRAKGWYDYVLNDQSTPWGNRAAWPLGTAPKPATPWNKQLSDKGAPALSQFDGIYLLDAFVSQDFSVGEMPAQVRAGRQAINWGEGLFIRGISQLSPLDVAALRRPGTELKEALMPTWSVTANLGLSGGQSLDAFYQVKWEPMALEYCGTFWNMIHATLAPDPGACNVITTGVVLPTDGTSLLYSGTQFAQVKGKTPKDSGAWGLSYRVPLESIDTEVALYAMNVSSTIPIMAGKGTVVTYPVPGVGKVLYSRGFGTTFPSTVLSFEYPEDIQIYGISAATTRFGISWGAELSYQKNVPAALHANDMNAFLGQNTAYRETAKALLSNVPDGQTYTVTTYERHNKTQLIVNGVALLGEMARAIGATNGSFVGEVGFEKNDLPDYRNPGAVRFGRTGSWGGYVKPDGVTKVAGAAGCTAPTGASVEFCQNDGYATDFSWGYRVRASVTYPQIFGTSWSASPSLYVGRDVSGFAMDGQFQEGRQTVSLGLELDLNKAHTINLGYTTYSGKWNEYRDHDNASFSYTYSF